jgi:hypothetical protein
MCHTVIGDAQYGKTRVKNDTAYYTNTPYDTSLNDTYQKVVRAGPLDFSDACTLRRSVVKLDDLQTRVQGKQAVCGGPASKSRGSSPCM